MSRSRLASNLAGSSKKIKFSRRKATIEELAAILNVHDPEAKAKLGATTRLGKVNLREEDLTDYWKSKLSDADIAAVTNWIKAGAVMPD